METQQQNHTPNTNELNNQDPSSNLAGGGILGNSKNNTATSNYLCRQSSTRWTPTTDQIRILKDLYYNNGIRSPTADQIQRISARLRQYGKIEGKNVFYWFQNHKARERQKKRFTGNDLQNPSSFNMNINFSPIQRSAAAQAPLPPNHLHIYNNNHKQIYPNISPAPGVPCSTSACSSPAGVLGVGQIGGCANYGSVAMEKSFRDCSISQGGIQNCGWVGADQYSSTYHSFLDKRKPFDHETLVENLDHQEEEEEEEDQETPELATLPLFPMHGDHCNSNGFFKSTSDSSGYYTGSTCYRSGDYTINGGSRASLELSLNSYTGWSMDLHH